MCSGQVVEDLGDRPVLQLAADLAEQPQRLVGDADPVGAGSISRMHSSARVIENRMERGNSRSSSRNSAAFRALGTPR